MRTFRLSGGWPPICVNIDAESGVVTVLFNGRFRTLLISCVGDPRTLRGDIPGVQGWYGICRHSHTGFKSSSGTFFHLKIEQISRKFNYVRRTAVLEIPISAEGGHCYDFREMPFWYWPLMLKCKQCITGIIKIFAAIWRNCSIAST